MKKIKWIKPHQLKPKVESQAKEAETKLQNNCRPWNATSGVLAKTKKTKIIFIKYLFALRLLWIVLEKLISLSGNCQTSEFYICEVFLRESNSSINLNALKKAYATMVIYLWLIKLLPRNGHIFPLHAKSLRLFHK